MTIAAKQQIRDSKWKVSPTDWDDISDTNPDVLTSRNFTYKAIGTEGGRTLYLGRENASRIKCFMFKASRNAVQEKDLPATKGLEVRFDFGFTEKEEVAIVLKLMNDDFLDVFVALLNDIIVAIRPQKEEPPFVAAFFNRLGVWKLFLDNSGAKGLSPERRRGLFGELYFLKEILIPQCGLSSLRYWVGPESAVHDFELGGGAIEIKTSAGKKSQRITISSERQLDDEGYSVLYLTDLSIAVRRNASPNLVEMITSVEELLSADQVLLVQFRNLLLMSGYSPIHNDLYFTEGYHIEEVNYYTVREGFPRLVGKDLQPGVGSIKYTVDLSACTDFRVDTETVRDFLTRITKTK